MLMLILSCAMPWLTGSRHPCLSMLEYKGFLKPQLQLQQKQHQEQQAMANRPKQKRGSGLLKC